jgi:hypothetical protein
MNMEIIQTAVLVIIALIVSGFIVWKIARSGNETCCRNCSQDKEWYCSVCDGEKTEGNKQDGGW